MKKKQVWRYYCEFCNKSGCNAGAIKRHEAGCTNNPNRVCKFCYAMGETQKPMPQLIAALGDGQKEGLDNLKAFCFDCPACILAAIRQSGLQHGPDGDESGYDPGFSVDFNFKKAKEEFWQAQNEARAEAELNAACSYQGGMGRYY